MWTAIFEEIQLTPLRGRRNAQQYRKEQALVAEGREGYTELKPYAPLTRAEILRRRYRRLYRVDLKPRELRVDERLPSDRKARQFRADIRLTVKVANAMSVVDHRVEDPWAALEPVLLPPIRQLTRRHGLTDLSEVEQELQQFLTGTATDAVLELGLRITRASVSLDIDEDELKRQRDTLQDEHFQELDMLRVKHQVKVHQLRDEQQRELASLRAKHDRELEALREQHQRELHEIRRQLYTDTVGEPLPGLVLAKLAARPGGLEPGDLDKVIKLMEEMRWEDFSKPLQLLKEHNEVIKDWQRERLIEVLLNGLAARLPQAQPALAQEPIEAVVDNQPTEAVLIENPEPDASPPDPDASPADPDARPPDTPGG
jgi:flagellar motility protein MotE (MotC chaperone)